MGRAYTDAERRTIVEVARAANLMGLTQYDAADRATVLLGVPVSQSSVSRCVLAAPDVREAAAEEPETLFDWANLETSEQVLRRLDEIIRIMKEGR